MIDLLHRIFRLLARGWSGARKIIASEQLRRVRALAFQIYVLIALVGFAALAMLATYAPVFQPDVSITRELQEELNPTEGWLLGLVSWPGYGVQSFTLVALVVVFLMLVGLRWEAVSALVTAVGVGALNTLVKIAIRRPRPDASLVDVVEQLNSFSFPSGHVMFYTAFFGFLLFLTFTLLHRGRRLVLGLILFALVALVGLSRIYLGEHWASDVIGGYLLGSLALFVSIGFYRWGKRRFFTTQPVASQVDERGLTPAEQQELHETARSPLIPQHPIKQELHDDDSDRT